MIILRKIVRMKRSKFFPNYDELFAPYRARMLREFLDNTSEIP